MKEIIIEVPDEFGKTLKPWKANAEIKGELVRCKDCISWTAGRCGAFDIAMGREDFCSKAYPYVYDRGVKDTD